MMDALKSAFRAAESDLTDASETLKNATAYLNCVLSGTAIHDRAVGLVGGVAPPAGWPNKALRFQDGDLCQGQLTGMRPDAVYVVDYLSKAPKTLLDPMFSSVGANDAVELGIAQDAVVPWVLNKRRKLLWLSDWRDRNDQVVVSARMAARTLLAHLGLDWVVEPSGLLLLRLEPLGELFKPTCLDAGLLYLWKAAPDCPHHGLTRHLDSGDHAVREWVMSKEQPFRVTGVWHHGVGENIDLSSPTLPATFWQTCRNEILEYRSRNGRGSS